MDMDVIRGDLRPVRRGTGRLGKSLAAPLPEVIRKGTYLYHDPSRGTLAYRAESDCGQRREVLVKVAKAVEVGRSRYQVTGHDGHVHEVVANAGVMKSFAPDHLTQKSRPAPDVFSQALAALGKSAHHPGFAAVERQIAAEEGVSEKRAGAILASRTRGASQAAKRKNPRLNRVPG